MRGKRFNLRVISVLVALLVVSTIFMGGCAEEPTEEDIPTPPTVPVSSTGYSDVKIPIGQFQLQPHVDVVMSTVLGGELTITLGSNPTTGYQWLEDAEIGDESIIQQTSHIFTGPGIEEPPGTPDEETWTFKALERGTTTILLEYSRSWNDAGLWAVAITATIK